jgi:hypothetical protein
MSTLSFHADPINALLYKISNINTTEPEKFVNQNNKTAI